MDDTNVWMKYPLVQKEGQLGLGDWATIGVKVESPLVGRLPCPLVHALRHAVQLVGSCQSLH